MIEINRIGSGLQYPGKRKDWKEDLIYQVTLPRVNAKFTIEYQEWVLQQVVNTKTVMSKGPFRIKLSNNKVLASGISETEPLVRVIVWRDRYGSGIKSDGTMEYKLPLSKAKTLPEVYYDETNQSYAVDDRKVY